MQTSLIAMISLFPLLGAVLSYGIGRKTSVRVSGAIASFSVLASLMVSIHLSIGLYTLHHEQVLKKALPSVYYISNQIPAYIQSLYTWFSTSDFRIEMAWQFDSLTAVMTLVVCFVGLLIHLYSIGYMAEEKDHARYFACLNLFCE